MPKSVTVTLTDDQLYSVEEYLATQTIPYEDPTTKATRVRKVHESVDAFIQSQIGNLVASIVQQYPNPGVQAALEQIARLKAQVDAASRPELVKETGPQSRP